MLRESFVEFLSNQSSQSGSTATRQPMCPGGKIQLPSINGKKIENVSVDKNGEFKKNTSSGLTMNSNILSHDLCYNRCSNGEAPIVDSKSGQYYCLVPSLITYKIKQGVKPTESDKGVPDSIDYSSPYTASCQSTDLISYEPQIGNAGNTMFGMPILLKSGLYEDPMDPNTLRSPNYDPNGDLKWFCKRVMYGAPPLGSIQSPYETISTDIVNASTNVSKECKSIIESNSVGANINDAGSQKTTSECAPNLNASAAIAISAGIPIVLPNPGIIKNELSIQQDVNSKSVSVPNTQAIVNPDTGVVTRNCATGDQICINSAAMTSQVVYGIGGASLGSMSANGTSFGSMSSNVGSMSSNNVDQTSSGATYNR